MDIENDYTEDLVTGKFEGKTYFWKFGKGEVGTTENTICAQNTDYVYPSESILMDLVSTSALDVGVKLIFSGLDKYWKKQSETVTLNGTTPVTTLYKYLRITRIEVISEHVGEIRCTETGTTGTPYYGLVLEGAGRTQQCLFSVPMGHTIFIYSLDYSSYNNKKTNIFFADRDYMQAEKYGVENPGFRTVLNSNIINNDKGMSFKYPFPVTEKQDVEARGYTETGFDNVTAMMFGFIKQNNSVPIDVSNLTVIAGNNSVSLSWDTLTPSENQDQKYFKIEVSSSDGTIFKEAQVDDTGLLIDDLTNGTEYTFTVYFIGYDMLSSSGVSVVATPMEV